MNFDPKNPASTELFSVDFVRQLAAGVTLTSAQATAIAVIEGVDGAAASMISGSATVNGTTVNQMVTAGVSGVHYRLTFKVGTSDGETLAESVDLWVRS